MGNPRIQIVNKHDRPIGSAPFEKVWKEGLIHRVVRVMVEDPDGRVLLQKRLPDRDLHPDRWDNSAAGHVDEDDDYLPAARRELAEEIGLNDIELEELGYYETRSSFEWRKLHRFNRAYRAIVSADTEFRIQPDEVESVQWFTVKAVKAMIRHEPEAVSDGIIEVFDRFY